MKDSGGVFRLSAGMAVFVKRSKKGNSPQKGKEGKPNFLSNGSHRKKLLAQEEGGKEVSPGRKKREGRG